MRRATSWLAEIDATTADKSSLAKLSYTYNADDNVTSFAQAYLGKAVGASGAAAGIVGPWIDGIGNEPKTSSKSDSATPRNRLGTFFAWCAPFVLALFFLLRRSGARRRLGWLAPALLGVFLGGCGGCSSNDSGAAGPPSTTYLHDAANRLTAAQDVGPASYTYDAASNLTSIKTSAKSSAGGTTAQSYSYSATNGINGATYDANGNPTSLGGVSYIWDSTNRLASVTVGSTSSTFTYDGMSRLVRIVDKNGGNVVADRAFTWCGNERCAAHENLQGGSPVVTRYFDQGVVDAGQAFYQIRDLLGSVRQVVDAAGKVRAQFDYDPYGNRTKVSGDVDSEIGYAGYYHHAASGLDLTLYRAYDASHGRWLNRDPIGEAGGTHVYQYVGSNPVNGIDPDGLFPLSFSPAGFGIGFVEGYIIAAGFNAAGQALSSTSGCIDWGQANEAGLVGGLLGGLGAGVSVGSTPGGDAPIVWPPNRGFTEGSGGDATILPGQVLDRYGGPGGSFLSPADTPFPQRSLPPGSESRTVNSYEVLQPFQASAGTAAPAFGQPGGGMQIDLGDRTVQDLVDQGILRKR